MLDLNEHRFLREPGAEIVEQTTRAVHRTGEGKIETANQTFIEYDYDENVNRIKEEVRIAGEKISKLPSSLHPGV